MHKVKSLAVFSSAVRNELTPNSDIDMMVDIDVNDPFEYTDHYFILLDELQQLFKRPVDLSESRSPRNPYLQRVKYSPIVGQL